MAYNCLWKVWVFSLEPWWHPREASGDIWGSNEYAGTKQCTLCPNIRSADLPILKHNQLTTDNEECLVSKVETGEVAIFGDYFHWIYIQICLFANWSGCWSKWAKMVVFQEWLDLLNPFKRIGFQYGSFVKYPLGPLFCPYLWKQSIRLG